MSIGAIFFSKTVNFFVGVFQVSSCVLFGLMFNAGFFVVAYQAYKYLRYGVWPEFALAYLVQYGPDWFTSWVYSPTSWLGLHELTVKALTAIPLSISLMVTGGITMLLIRIEGTNCFNAIGGGK
jgi:hypothetical protein